MEWIKVFKVYMCKEKVIAVFVFIYILCTIGSGLGSIVSCPCGYPVSFGPKH